jgi:hypothetical protein
MIMNGKSRGMWEDGVVEFDGWHSTSKAKEKHSNTASTQLRLKLVKPKCEIHFCHANSLKGLVSLRKV